MGLTYSDCKKRVQDDLVSEASGPISRFCVKKEKIEALLAVICIGWASVTLGELSL
jgi:hypothetical protein